MRSLLPQTLLTDVERCGFILDNDELVEVPNTAKTPAIAFNIAADDILRYENRIKATWHTHPASSCTLSVGDYHTFMAWPKWHHLILGTDGVSEYHVEKGMLLNA